MADTYLNKTGLTYFWGKIVAALGLKVDQSDFDVLERYYRSLVPVGTEITANKDLNTLEFLSVGKYFCKNDATTATLTNCPTNRAFMMEVFSPLSTTIDNETTGTWVYRVRLITTHLGDMYIQKANSSGTAGAWSYGAWKKITNEDDVNNLIDDKFDAKFGYVRNTNYSATDGQYVKIASYVHHNRSNDNVNYTFRLDYTTSTTNIHRQSFTFGIGLRTSNTTANPTPLFEFVDYDEFLTGLSGKVNINDILKVTKKWVVGTSSTDHYIYFEIWIKMVAGWRTFYLHPLRMNYKNDYGQNKAFTGASDEWTYYSVYGTSTAIGEETYLEDGYSEVALTDRRKTAYVDNYYLDRPTTLNTSGSDDRRGGLRTFLATSSTTTGKPISEDGHIIQLDWDNNGGYDVQLYAANKGTGVFYRGQTAGTWGDWKKFILEEDIASKVNRNSFYNTTTDSVVYKKVTITGLPGATETSGSDTYRGAGAFIFGRQQFYAISGSAGSGNKTVFYEIGSNNNGKAININDMNLHIKAVYGGGSNPPKVTLYVALERYGYCDIHSSGTITIEDSDSTEWEGITANIECKPILASLTKASGGDLGNITAGADSQGYLEVTKLSSVTDIDTLKTTGLYIIGVSGCTNVPSGAGWGTIYVDWTIGTKYQIYINDGDAWKIWKRKWNSSTSAWGSWVKQVETSDIKDGVLTIQKNGENVQTFSANQSSNVTANIEVPTKVSDIENDLNFVEDDTTQICNEGSILSVDNTTDSPLKVNKLSGNIEQANYSGKNLFAYIGNVKSSESGVTGTLSADGTITYSGTLSANNRYLTNDIDITSILEDGQVYTVSQTESFGDALSLEIRGRKTGTTTYSYWSTRSSTGSGSFTVNKTTYDEYKVWIIGKTSGTTGWGSTSRTLSAKYMLEKSSSATSWEPYVGGKESPSPDYPQIINNVTGRNVVRIRGKNLISSDWETGAYNTGTGVKYGESNSLRTANRISVEPNTTYILSRGGSGVAMNVLEYKADGTFIGRNGNAATAADNSFTTSSETAFVTLYRSSSGGVEEMMLEKGSAITDYEEFQGSTDYEINLGKNLLNKEDAVVGALLVDGTIDSTNYPNCRTTGYIAVKPNTAYCVSGRTTWSVQGEYAKDKTFISRSTGDSFTTGPNTYYVRVVCVNSELGNMQFEAGSVATSYSDYFEPIELSGINEYIDYIWRDGEDFYIHREIGKYVFDGSETYARNGTYNFQTNTPFADYLKSSIEDDMAISDNFIYFANSGGSISTLLPDLNFAFSQDKTRAQFRYDAISSAEDFKTWMTNNPTKVYYVLLNPTEEKITNEGLIEQLKALWYASGYNGQTNILVLPSSGNATGSISICQYPSHMPVATAYQLGNVIAGEGLDIEESGRISINTSYVGNNITKISNSEIDIIMGVA